MYPEKISCEGGSQLTATGFEELKRASQTEECGSLWKSLQNAALDFSPMRPTQTLNHGIP